MENENPFYAFHRSYRPTSRPPYYYSPPPTAKTTPARKVVSIPVHYVRTEQSKLDSAVKIQKVFRGFLVRKSMKKILEIRKEVDEIEKRILLENGSTVELMRKDSKERIEVNEMLMCLLFRLDSVFGVDSGVRDCRKAVIKKAIRLQENVDSIVVVDSEIDGGVESGEILGKIVDDRAENVDNFGKVADDRAENVENLGKIGDDPVENVENLGKIGDDRAENGENVGKIVDDRAENGENLGKIVDDQAENVENLGKIGEDNADQTLEIQGKVTDLVVNSASNSNANSLDNVESISMRDFVSMTNMVEGKEIGSVANGEDECSVSDEESQVDSSANPHESLIERDVDDVSLKSHENGDIDKKEGDGKKQRYGQADSYANPHESLIEGDVDDELLKSQKIGEINQKEGGDGEKQCCGEGKSRELMEKMKRMRK